MIESRKILVTTCKNRVNSIHSSFSIQRQREYQEIKTLKWKKVLICLRIYNRVQGRNLELLLQLNQKGRWHYKLQVLSFLQFHKNLGKQKWWFHHLPHLTHYGQTHLIFSIARTLAIKLLLHPLTIYSPAIY